MIIIKLTLNALLEKQEEILQTLLAMVGSMGKEKGCRSYQVLRNIKNGAMFNSIGEWTSREDLFKYLKSDKFGVLLGTKSLLSKPMQIQILTVTRMEGIKLINSLRSECVLLASPVIEEGEVVKV